MPALPVPPFISNLYVDDGAVLPRPLGVNPSLTIGAVAERTCALIAQDRGWNIDYQSLGSKPRQTMAAATAGVEFTETMKGYFSTKVKDDFGQGAKIGREDGSSSSSPSPSSRTTWRQCLPRTRAPARMLAP